MLQGKRAIVTGGSRGIGKAIARSFAEEGMSVVIASRGRQALSAAAYELSKCTDSIVNSVVVDTGLDDSVRNLISEAKSILGGIDILVNCAARPGGQSTVPTLSGVTTDEFNDHMNVKVMGYLRCAREAAPIMVDQGWGRIINFAGMNAIHGYNGRAHVSASKHATWGMTKALAKEFGAKGITTNIVSPGPISGQHKDPAMAAHIADMATRVPVGRLGTSEEVAATCMLLISEKGAFINGQLIQVNGGTET